MIAHSNFVSCLQQALSLELFPLPGRIVGIKCDVTKEEEILDMFKFIRCEFGAIHVCVNSAGIAHQASLLEGKTADWRSMFEVRIICVKALAYINVKSLSTCRRICIYA